MKSTPQDIAQKEKLDQFAINIEFLLISVIQGVALGALATNAYSPVQKLELEYIPYIISGFLFILNFWSQAIIHTLSFIDWPLDLTHNFLYFLVSFVEVMAFAEVTNPLRWFDFISLFFLVAFVLYIVDLLLIRKHEKKYHDSDKRRKLYQHILKREKFEIYVFLPLGLAFNIFSSVIIRVFPEVFLGGQYHVILIILQVLFGFIFLLDSTKNFKKRSELISPLS